MSSSASSSKPADKQQEKEDTQPHLGVLEEDDEFEEFEVADWDDSSTDLAHLKGAAPGVAKSAGDKLWEDNWDDDESRMSLANELSKAGKATGDPMQQ
ncbi:hypothetical protein BDR07DRAFT_1451659 [Suillus spraguei]|nr:hypothetical protein BDR07DRAFT_1451659 [Suillus spraguei]